MPAPRSKSRRHTLKPDDKGQYRVGVKAAKGGTLVAVRFNFDTALR